MDTAKYLASARKRLKQQFTSTANICSDDDDDKKGKSCGGRDRKSMKIPTVWKSDNGKIMKGQFCEVTGEWHWETVASCKYFVFLDSAMFWSRWIECTNNNICVRQSKS